MRLYRLYLTENECFQVGERIIPKGVMLHSTGANNPALGRYVGPDDGRLASSDNHWNRFRPGGKQVCVHAFVGRLVDGSTAAYQTLPWEMRGWHCGGTGNDTHIGIELCEDGLEDEAYFHAVCREAAQLTAHLCRLFALDPAGNGTVLSHQEGHRLGIASNHGDVGHWFSRFGYTMEDFRARVAGLLEGEENALTQREFDTRMENWLAQRGREPVSGWAASILERAQQAKVTDGSRPRAFATREEVAAMVMAAQKAAEQ